MKLEEQVCTLEQAKKLKELGVPQKTIFYWLDRSELSRVVFEKNIEFLDILPIVSAYTVAELGELLPGLIQKEGFNNYFNCNHIVIEQGWEASYCRADLPYQPCLLLFEAPTEAQARAAMLIHLLENRIITL